MEKINNFIKRLEKIGISVEIFANYPWIYLDKVNGNTVKEIFFSNHKFTLAFSGVKRFQEPSFTDITEIFKLIRKYK